MESPEITIVELIARNFIIDSPYVGIIIYMIYSMNAASTRMFELWERTLEQLTK